MHRRDGLTAIEATNRPCPTCGKDAAGDAFCGACGSRIEEAPDQQPSESIFDDLPADAPGALWAASHAREQSSQPQRPPQTEQSQSGASFANAQLRRGMLAAGGVGVLILVVVLVAGQLSGPSVGSVGEAESAISNRFKASDVVCREDGERFDCDVTTYNRNGQVSATTEVGAAQPCCAYPMARSVGL